jgi:hypothetical protein
VVGQDARDAIVLRQKWSRGQIEARLANMPPCLIGEVSWHRRRNVKNSQAKGDCAVDLDQRSNDKLV